MGRLLMVSGFLSLFLGISCSPIAQPRKSFEEICKNVEGKTTTEVKELLGEPNLHQVNQLGIERWIWWNYAVLDGDSYPPEVRGRIVHLEISFAAPSGHAGGSLPHSQWRVRQPFGVSYMFPNPKQSI